MKDRKEVLVLRMGYRLSWVVEMGAQIKKIDCRAAKRK